MSRLDPIARFVPDDPLSAGHYAPAIVFFFADLFFGLLRFIVLANPLFPLYLTSHQGRIPECLYWWPGPATCSILTQGRPSIELLELQLLLED